MGLFLATSAFRTEDLDAVLDAVPIFFRTNSWPTEQITGNGAATADDIRVFAPENGWTVVLWPPSFIEEAAARFMSRGLGVLASSVRVHDGDYWRHVLLRDGDVLDRFASMPEYFTDDPGEVARLRARFAGHPAVVAAAVGCTTAQLAPYLVHADLDHDGEFVDHGKAFPEDRSGVDNPWVFASFWAQFGPHYPDDPEADKARIRLAPGWMEGLPYRDGDL
ncbi:hypothetical protein [Actinoplanes sp. NPDC051494]|uniref:hypothetical protein n=1 Tax=Actinoplanes sp. NPDC051494 TaxID=3363907 RepID=UPI0037BB4C95